ncbi:MAG: SDR family NAD(P)-dependent oxidoreductase [Acidimicrobiales bacterium]
MDLGLTGKVALLSASHRGTGAGTARVLATEGAVVAVHGFEAGQPDAVVAAIADAGGTAIGVSGPLDSDGDAAAIVDAVEAQVGPVDILVNNYGEPLRHTWATPADEWAAGWDRNLLTGVRLTQRVTPGMVERGWGRVVFLSTVGTGRPGRDNADYYGAKAALHPVARSLAKELAGTGVTANVVSPGLIATDEVRAMVTRRAEREGVAGSWEEVAAWASRNILPNLTGRLATPGDIGRLVAFVAGESGWHLNGADLRIDGGALDA